MLPYAPKFFWPDGLAEPAFNDTGANRDGIC